MWSQLFKVASLSKGALVVGVAASAAMVSNGEFSNTPSRNELPNVSPVSSVAPATRTAPRPASSPSPLAEPKKAEVPTAQLPGASPSASPKNEPSSGPSASALQHGAVPEIFKECVERYLAIREQGDAAPAADRQLVGEVCKAALAQSGLSGAEFWAKFGPDAHKTEPKTETPKPTDPEALVKECIAQRQAGTADQSDACRNAIAASGLTPQEFWTKFSKYLDTAKTDVESWIRECVTKYTRHATDATETCKKAIGLTGLTSAQFAEKYLRTTSDTKPTTSPATRPATAEFEQLVYTCRKLQGALNDASTNDQVNAANAVCDKAISASGLGSEDFWKKWPVIKPTTAPATTKPVTNTTEVSGLVAKCLELYKTVTSTSPDTKSVSEACGAAIKATGLTSAAFWAKYHPATN